MRPWRGPKRLLAITNLTARRLARLRNGILIRTRCWGGCWRRSASRRSRAMLRTKLNIIVSGMIAADPYQGGATWAVLQYVLGFCRLGHSVHFLEPVKPQSLQPAGTS